MDNGALWTEIDHAERCLVSAMYEEAVGAATSILSVLSTEARNEVYRPCPQENASSIEGDARAELLPMVEAAGMVLLQALNELDRSSSIFDNLVSLFGSVDSVPYTLLLTGTCLQLAGDVHPSLKSALEEYLSGWTIGSSADDFMVKIVQLPPESPHVDRISPPTSATSSSSSHYLARKDYLQLTEIYAMEIVAKVYKDAKTAYHWIQDSSITEEEKQVIAERLELWSESQRPSVDHRAEHTGKQKVETYCETTSSTDNKSVHKWEDGPKLRTFEKETIAARSESSLSAKADPDGYEETQSEQVVKGTGIWRLPVVKLIERLVKLIVIRAKESGNSQWARLKHVKVLQPNTFAKGAVIYVIFCAVLLKRQQLRRWAHYSTPFENIRYLLPLNFQKILMNDILLINSNVIPKHGDFLNIVQIV